MGPVIITTAILVVCFLVNADFVGKTCSQHHWNIVVSIYFWFCLQSKVSRKGRWSLPRMFFVAFVQFVSKLFFPNLYWDFNGWACNPVPGPQGAQRRVVIIVTSATGEPREFRWAGSRQDKRLERAIFLPIHISGLGFTDSQSTGLGLGLG